MLALVHVARRLRQYFYCHRVVVRTDYPISKVLRKHELARRMIAWPIELLEFDIRLKPIWPIKAQHLANFINELHLASQFKDQWWTIHMDGSNNKKGCGARVLLERPNQMKLDQFLRFSFKASNNQAEYQALLVSLWLAKELGAKKIKCWSDSKVATEQIKREYQVKDPQLLKYYHAFIKLRDEFKEV